MGLCAQGHPKVTKKRGSEKQRQLAIVRSCQQLVNTLPLSHQEPEINKKKNGSEARVSTASVGLFRQSPAGI